jgi:xanthine dehydrogenase accessory factor
MHDWVSALAGEAAAGNRAVLVSVAHAAGSAPRDAGTAMVVTATTIHGTIGGGHLEFEARRIARDALASVGTPAPWLVRFPLAARLGQCCGGVATLAFAVVAAPRWLEAAVASAHEAVPFALVTRIGAGGDAVAQMLVTADDATGTLGDAALDSEAVAQARARVRASGAWLLASAARPERTTLVVHVVAPPEFDVLVFGNGHVGRALAQVLGTLPARVRWIDSREHDFPPAVPANVDVIASDSPDEELAHAPHGAYVLILTHSHALDFALVEAALRRDDWRYLGLIGSRSKRAQFEKRLAVRGFGAAQVARITCPIGFSTSGIRSKEPGAIAVAVAAELLATRERAARLGTVEAGHAVPAGGTGVSRRTS